MLILILFLIFNSLSRLSLISFALFEKQIDWSIIDLAQVLGFGACNDFITACYFLAPIAFLKLFYNKNNWFFRSVSYFFYFSLIMGLCFLIVSEFTFWLEFSTRFNFIAVDYLIYTHEIIGNIRESYPVFIIFPALFAVVIVIFYKMIPIISNNIKMVGNFKIKIQQFVLFSLLSISSFFFYDPKITDIKGNNYLSELSKNGIHNLFSAFLHNSIDYYNLYKTIDTDVALNDLYSYISSTHKLERPIIASKAPNNYNVMLITVESLSHDFLSVMHNDKPITPVINDLINKSIYFNNFYATGTRTVRGLEAITLSIPPIPGQSILRRENNENLFSIASVLNKENYDLKFIYGGYGYFDNMNYFFSNNNFKSLDRSVFPKQEIEFANIWGVSDEDLYKQAIKQADISYDKKQKFFSLVMTTSNHRPYTYPDNRIDIPSKSGREGGVKYTDYALGEFLKIASSKPWFDNTIFVITADHCAGSAGKTALPPHKYHIPLLIYAPKIFKPQVIDRLTSQIDLAPTILGLLDISYNSRFFGNDAFKNVSPNAFISTFQKLGYIENNKLVVLSPAQNTQTYNLLEDNVINETSQDDELIKRAIAYYQSAYYLYQNGLLKENYGK